MTNRKIGNKHLLKYGLGLMVFTVVMLLTSFIISLIPAVGPVVSWAFQITAFFSMTMGTLICLISGHKKFIWSMIAYLIMLILTIVFNFVGPNYNTTGAIAISLILYALGAVSKLLVILGYKNINDNYHNTNKINSILIFICILIAIVEIIFDVINLTSGNGKNYAPVLAGLGIASEVSFVFVLFFTWKTLKKN